MRVNTERIASTLTTRSVLVSRGRGPEVTPSATLSTSRRHMNIRLSLVSGKTAREGVDISLGMDAASLPLGGGTTNGHRFFL